MSGPHIAPALFTFLRQLKRNNNRAWFQEHKKRYESDVRDPLLRFIAEFRPHLHKISLHYVADARPMGGSLFRIYRDTRFSRDKSPYKTVAAVQFRHEKGKDVHAPGFYLHLEPGNVFAGVGLWHPSGDPLRMVRDAIAEHPDRWNKVLRKRTFRDRYELAGELLKRPPRGYDPKHPMIEDLKRKDFIAVTQFDEKQACSSAFLKEYVAATRAATPFMEFLTRAVGLPW
ncbi:MAG: DUF2461 domain-containing protein [Gemmatimonadota bacterium]|nr:DUF2461 domain-containing protein [Gemmatimonadota bacterium]